MVHDTNNWKEKKKQKKLSYISKLKIYNVLNACTKLALRKVRDARCVI